LKGERRVVGKACPGCSLDADRKRRKNPLRMAQNRETLRALRRQPEYAAKMREADRIRQQTPERRARDNERHRRQRQDPVGRARMLEWALKSARRPERLAKNRERYANDSGFALGMTTRARIWLALKGKAKAARTFALLGIDSIEQYKTYLEKQFEPGMTWENYGATWHVDHRIPLSLLDLSKPQDQYFGFNYKNTRPMLAAKNVSRGNRIVFQDLL